MPQRRPLAPLDPAQLERLALTYVERFATSTQKLRRYLQRKVRERGFENEGGSSALIDEIVQKMMGLGYVSDPLFAEMRTRGLRSKGYGDRRIAQALYADGISKDISSAARGDDDPLAAAHYFAKRRRFGPYGAGEMNEDMMRRQLSAMARAGHSFAVASQVLRGRRAEDQPEEE